MPKTRSPDRQFHDWGCHEQSSLWHMIGRHSIRHNPQRETNFRLDNSNFSRFGKLVGQPSSGQESLDQVGPCWKAPPEHMLSKKSQNRTNKSGKQTMITKAFLWQLESGKSLCGHHLYRSILVQTQLSNHCLIITKWLSTYAYWPAPRPALLHGGVCRHHKSVQWMINKCKHWAVYIINTTLASITSEVCTQV